MISNYPFSKLSKMLEELGFRPILVDGRPQRVFRHDAADATIMLPQTPDAVPAIYLKGIARILDDTGLMERQDFERRLYDQNGHRRSNGRKKAIK